MVNLALTDEECALLMLAIGSAAGAADNDGDKELALNLSALTQKLLRTAATAGVRGEEENTQVPEEADKAGQKLARFLRDRGIFAWPETEVAELICNKQVRLWLERISDQPMEGYIVAYTPVGKR